MSQTSKILDLLKDDEPHSTQEIKLKIYGNESLGLARIAARVHDLKKQGYSIKGWRDKKNPVLYWYQLAEKSEASAEYTNKAAQFSTKENFHDVTSDYQAIEEEVLSKLIR